MNFMEPQFLNINWMLGIVYFFVAAVLITVGRGEKKGKQAKNKIKLNSIYNVLNYLPGFVILPSLIYITIQVLNQQFVYSGFIVAGYKFQILGLMVLVSSYGLYALSIATMKQQFATGIVVKKKAKVIQEGPFKLIRHPIYVSWFLMFVALFLILQQTVFLWGLVVVFSWYFYRSVLEEKILSKNLPGYKNYRKKTKRFIPFIF